MKSKWIKRAISLVALAVFTYLFWPLFKEIKNAAYLFQHAKWVWLPVILLIQLASYSWLTWLNSLTLKPFPGHIHFFRLMAVLSSIAFIEIAIPSAGASGVALRIRLLGKQGYSVEAATFTLALETIFLAIAMSTIGLIGLFYLLQHGKVSQSQLAIISVLVIVVLIFIWYAWRALHDPQRGHQVVGWFVRLWNRLFCRWRRLDEQLLEQRLEQFQTNLGNLTQIPGWMFVLAAYGRVLMDVVTLGCCFRMFSYSIGFNTLITGYGLILLLSGVAALPGGFGLAEISIPVIFNQLGVPGAVAIAAGLTYRLIAFWFVRFVGFFAWQYLEGGKSTLKELKEADGHAR
jgi:uncharacterized protein (TIRG00374 family)